MTAQTMEAVRREVTVQATPERAFEVFTAGINSWWPASHHISENPLEDVIEPRSGGRVFTRNQDGSETEWARVLAWEPPDRLVLAWHLDPDWVFDPDTFSQVEIRFVPDGSGSTRVELEHRGFEAYGDRGAVVRDSVGSEEGWGHLLALYGDAAGR